jgi:hypothetical protein
MMQYIIVITAVVISGIYIISKIRKSSKGCDPSKCSGCSLYSDCGKEIKKSRP